MSIDPIALESAVYWLMCERSAQMGEAYTHEMHEAAKAEDQDYISDIRFQVKSAIKAYEAAKTVQPVGLSGVLQVHNDDCVSACVATLFGLSLADIPRFDAIDWHEQLCEWLNVRGYGLVNISFTGEQKDGIPSGYTIGAISSQIRDGWKHCVICLDGMIVWDPKKGKRDGTKRAEEYTIIYPLSFISPKRESGSEPVCECDEISNGETCVRCGPPSMRTEYCIKAFATWAVGRGFNLERGTKLPFSSQFTQGYYELWQELWECFPMQRAINHAVAKMRDMIDGGEECAGRDSEISDVIRMLEGNS